MTTTGNFDPPGIAPCPAPMTRAALIALRNAGGLRTECHYIVTDGPVIGTAGNTSPTVIQLHAASTNYLSLEAEIRTTFDPDTAWVGEYDIDLGSAGSIQKLTDLWNNTALDADANAPTVHTEVPWHKGGPDFRDNTFDDCSLPGWSAAVGNIRDNILRETTVDLTGMTSPGPAPFGFFRRNTITGGSFTTRTATVYADHNQMVNSIVSHLGTSAGSFSYQLNTMLGGNVSIDAATTSQVTINSNVFGGGSGGFVAQIQGKTVGEVILADNRLFVSGPDPYNLRIQNTGFVHIVGCELNAPVMTFNSPGDVEIDGCTITDGTFDKPSGSTGPLTMTRCTLLGGAFTSSGTGAGGSAVTGCYLNDSTITLNANSSGALTVRQTDTNGSTLTASASGSATPIVQRGRVLGSTLDTAGFNIDVFDIVGGTKTLTADQSDRVRNALGSNLI